MRNVNWDNVCVGVCIGVFGILSALVVPAVDAEWDMSMGEAYEAKADRDLAALKARPMVELQDKLREIGVSSHVRR